MTITEKRTLFPDDVRKLCREYQYYNAGSNVEYACFLDTLYSLRNENITNEDLYIFAKDIYDHTSSENFDDDGERSETERIGSIMYDLARICRSAFFITE